MESLGKVVRNGDGAGRQSYGGGQGSGGSEGFGSSRDSLNRLLDRSRSGQAAQNRQMDDVEVVGIGNTAEQDGTDNIERDEQCGTEVVDEEGVIRVSHGVEAELEDEPAATYAEGPEGRAGKIQTSGRESGIAKDSSRDDAVAAAALSGASDEFPLGQPEINQSIVGHKTTAISSAPMLHSPSNGQAESNPPDVTGIMDNEPTVATRSPVAVQAQGKSESLEAISDTVGLASPEGTFGVPENLVEDHDALHEVSDGDKVRFHIRDSLNMLITTTNSHTPLRRIPVSSVLLRRPRCTRTTKMRTRSLKTRKCRSKIVAGQPEEPG